MTGFKTAHDFRKFSDLVRRQRRFFQSDEASSFLSALSDAVKGREVVLKAGRPLWRAQIGYRLWHRQDAENQHKSEEVPFPPRE